MKKITAILKDYLGNKIPAGSILLSFLMAALFTFLQYRFHLKSRWLNGADGHLEYIGRHMLFFGTPLLIYALIWRLWKGREAGRFVPGFFLLLLVALLAFALRSDFEPPASWVYKVSEHWDYGVRLLNTIFIGPVLCVLPVIWWLFTDRKQERLYGCSFKNVSWGAYGWMLLIMVPLIVLASTQGDFTRYYPKAAKLFSEEFQPTLKRVGIYELFYGLDFVYIEFFFRGFMVIAFARFLGPVSIPFAALLYCSIHFGKPLGETISSWFGGMLLGILALETRSIMGGIMVHMGIAWLMELGGWIGRWYGMKE